MLETQNPKEIELLQKAKVCLSKGELTNAQMIYDEVVNQNENCAEAYFNLANIFHIQGNLGKAIKSFKKTLDLDPNHTDAAISLSVIYNDIGKYDEAKVIFERANDRIKKRSQGGATTSGDVHINKKFSLKHLELGELYFSYNRYDEALFEYNKVVSLDPENIEVRIKIAKTLAKKGFTSRAFDELRKIKNEYPSYIPARVAMGVLYYANGNIVEAQTEWQRVLSKDPYNKEASMYLNLSKNATETHLG
ncbi:MAG: tetratricopeptide repeat protein [Bacteriovoracaceae bacterium]